MSIQKNKTQIKKQKIFEVALKLFFEQGYSGTTIEDIRKKSGVSVGSLYHHFSNKEILADQLYLSVVEAFCTKGIKSITDSKSPKDLIENWITFHFNWFQKGKKAAHFMMSHQIKTLGILQQNTLIKIQEKFFFQFSQNLEEANSQESLNVTDPSLFFFILIGPTESFSRIWLLQEIPQALDQTQ
ncbi:MAG: TetR/AcrR family transcriptional regulator, partial [SAR324 cluster bacterium]|nr:TetR/AcrR family transcriptional regulator [SAR324 cluster bacterium]